MEVSFFVHVFLQILRPSDKIDRVADLLGMPELDNEGLVQEVSYCDQLRADAIA